MDVILVVLSVLSSFIDACDPKQSGTHVIWVTLEDADQYPGTGGCQWWQSCAN